MLAVIGVKPLAEKAVIAKAIDESAPHGLKPTVA
jgi:hypothetical protein